MADAVGDLEGVSNKEIMELLLLTQYFDMVKDVGQASKGSTLFMTHSPSAVNKVSSSTTTAAVDDTAQNLTMLTAVADRNSHCMQRI